MRTLLEALTQVEELDRVRSESFPRVLRDFVFQESRLREIMKTVESYLASGTDVPESEVATLVGFLESVVMALRTLESKL